MCIGVGFSSLLNLLGKPISNKDFKKISPYSFINRDFIHVITEMCIVWSVSNDKNSKEHMELNNNTNYAKPLFFLAGIS